MFVFISMLAILACYYCLYCSMLNAQAGVESDLTVSFIDGSSTASWEPSFQVSLNLIAKLKTAFLTLCDSYREKVFISQLVVDPRTSLLLISERLLKTTGLMRNWLTFLIVYVCCPFKDQKGKQYLKILIIGKINALQFFFLSLELMGKLSPTTRFTNEDFPFSTHKLIDIKGHICRALRISFVGEMGKNLFINPFPSYLTYLYIY